MRFIFQKTVSKHSSVYFEPMRKYFLILIFGLIASSAFSQTSTTDTTLTVQQVLQTDTTAKKDVDEGFNKSDQDQMRNNLDSFLQMQNERRAKQKRQAILYIAIGIGFLIIMIIGLMRHRKKTT